MTDILEGSKQLLDESISLLDNTIQDVIIVGGWGLIYDIKIDIQEQKM